MVSLQGRHHGIVRRGPHSKRPLPKGNRPCRAGAGGSDAGRGVAMKEFKVTLGDFDRTAQRSDELSKWHFSASAKQHEYPVRAVQGAKKIFSS